MMVVGLTGGIGSGKSTVANMFHELGVAVYIADDEAKKLMHTDKLVKQKIIDLLGDNSYVDGYLNRPYIANIVFNDKTILNKLNAIVHPAVANHFNIWKEQQKGEYVIKEAAILFENDGYKQCDLNILVTAPKEVRISRVLNRDKSIREEVISRMNNQWEDDEKIPLADFVIHNVDMKKTENQVSMIHREISS